MDAAPDETLRRRPVPEASNLRDLGGYRTADGATVKWRTLYRSNNLAGLSDAGVAAVAALGIRAYCDFRSESEQRAKPSRLPLENPPALVSLAIEPKVVDALRALIADPGSTGEDIAQLVAAAYRDYGRDHVAQYRAFFDRLVEGAHYPLLFHCAAGKDRTGYAAAMVLRAVGVPLELVYEDFLLTNQYWDGAMALNLEARPDLRAVLTGVRPDYLDAAFDGIDATYGTFDRYLEDGLGLTQRRLEALRDRLLE